MKYAQNTSVSSDKSRQEIERTLSRYGASGFMYGWSGSNCLVAFEMNNKRIKFILPLPNKKDREFTHTASRGSKRSIEDTEKVWEQACRQRWRALSLAIKAKLEAVSSGITTFEDEFMAHIVLPNGATVGSWLMPQLNESYTKNSMPPLLGFNG